MELTDGRVVPEFMNPRNGLVIEHVARYQFAANVVAGRVLDIACGAGYGSELLLQGENKHKIREIIGVDLEPEIIQYANETYGQEKISFTTGNVLDTGLKAKIGNFDYIVSYETVEHLAEDEQMIANLKSMLNPGGKLIISTPFGRGKGIPCSDPYHVHQYREEEFLELLYTFFPKVEMYHQLDEVIEKPIFGKKYYIMVAICGS